MSNTNNNVIQEIKHNYVRMEEALIAELFMTVNNHHLTAGTFREKIWKDFFENIIPKKFAIEQGAFLIDSHGKVSNETDLVIFDEQYTPYIFKNRNIKFIPYEAVAAVIQCKSVQLDTNNIKIWVDSIDKLNPVEKLGLEGYAGSALGEPILNKGRKIKPLKILCGLFPNSNKNETRKNTECDLIISANTNQDGKQDENNPLSIISSQHTIEELFKKITLSSTKKENNLRLKELEERVKELNLEESNSIVKELDNLKNRFESNSEELTNKKNSSSTNDKLINLELEVSNLEISKFKTEDFSIYKKDKKDKKDKKINLLTLVFQLNQYLMLINNPVLFPHRAYIEMFNASKNNIED
ncbi:DUF6602 domain-containing protein [Stenoxybacter acetivorans]|uniref:DUF6602 domain-containing protein n=1 Tax=Stenoxybacter acetivorans TaxID=422441 RepID=UPI00056B1786|nr:DUF6602 domain-containing protein [Stenoxybacter acetivorans]